MSRPILIIAGRRRPHELVFIGLSLLLGVLYTIGAPPPQSIVEQVWPWLVRIWSILLLISGSVGIASLAWRGRLDTALWLELGSMLIGAAALVIAIAAIFQTVGLRGVFGGGFATAWAIANLIRAGQIRRDLRKARP